MRNNVDKFLGLFLALLMSLMVVNVLWQVISRYILGSPSVFTDELATFMLIWVGLLGAAYATGHKRHLAIDILPNQLEVDKKKLLGTVISVFVIVFVGSSDGDRRIEIGVFDPFFRAAFRNAKSSIGLYLFCSAAQWYFDYLLYAF